MGEANMSVEHEAATKEQVITPIEQQPIEKITIFASRLAKIRADAKGRTQKIQLMLDGLKEPEAANKEAPQEFVPEDVLSQLEALGKDEALSPEDFLSQSRRVLQISEKLTSQAYQKQALEEEHFDLQHRDIYEIDSKIEELSRKKGIRKILSVPEKKRLIKEKSDMQGRLAQLENQIQAKIQLRHQVRNQEEPVLQKQEKTLLAVEEALMTAVAQEIAAIRSDYEQLLDAILQDGTMLTDIREAYIEQGIALEVDRKAEEEHKTKADKDGFYQALRTYIAHGEEPDIRISDHRKLLDSFHYGDVVYLVEPLLDGQDKKLIEDFVNKIAMQNTAPIKTIAESQWENYEEKNKFSAILEKALRPMTKPDKIHQPRYVHLNDKIQSWQGIKYSRKANELFGEEIQIQDQQYYQDILDKSVSSEKDNYEAVRSLYCYPTPDAIRNLVLLASAFTSEGNNPLNSVNIILGNLSVRKDWPDILDNATKIYPSLKTARPILENWMSGLPTNSYRHPEIQNAVQDFALSILDSKPTDQRLTALAENALNNHSNLDVLAKKGVISNSDAASLKEAERILLQKTQLSDYYIDDYFFSATLSNVLFPLLHQQEGITVDAKTQIKRFVALSQKILETNSDDIALSFLSSQHLIEKLQDQALNDNNIPILLNAYVDYPALVTANRGPSELLTEFCKQFSGKETVQLFKDISDAYSSFPDRTLSIVQLVGKSSISRERALELPTKAGDMIKAPIFYLAIKFPDIFLQTDEALVLLKEFDEKGLGILDPSVNLFFRQGLFKSVKNLSIDSSAQIPYGELLQNEFTRIDKIFTANQELEINESNWRSLLMTFVESQTGYFSFSEQSRKRIEDLFKNSHAKNFCLNSFKKEYVDYLSNGSFDQIPFGLYLTTEMIKYSGGAGPITQIESLSNFISAFCASLGKETVTEESRNMIFQRMHTIENRFDKEKWSNESRTNFYNISSNIITADSNLFSDYLELFNNLNPSDLKRFMREIYPLYGIQLALMEKTYDETQLVNLRKDIQAFALSIKTQEKPLETQKAKLIGEISRLFKERFGITKTPKEFTEENVRSLTNVSLYLANLSGRNATKESELGYYLSLMLNNKWDNFRRGEIIDPNEYLDPKKDEAIADILKKRAELNPLTPGNLGIQETDIPEFQRILQEETQNVAVGDIETIDVKLNNVILNLRQLQDPDLYPDLLDKQRMQLLLSFGNKKVGSTAAKMYQILQNPSKPIQFSDEEIKIREEITRIAAYGRFELTTENIKKHFQEGIRPLSTIVNMLQFVNETNAELEIENIRQLLQPSQAIIDVFNRLGEEFKPTSGALALSQDLDYLDNIIVKKEGSLSPNEKTLLVDYTGRIREQVVKLQEIFDKVRDKFSSLKQGSTTTNNQLLTDKLAQIDKIINATSAQQTITSRMTNNLNTIIENMRECLSCKTKGGNNDTNLTFGDINKFYLYSQSEGQEKGSISDEVLFLEPVTHRDGASEMAFVFDRIYGVQTPTILTNQLETVIKKYRQLKQRYPKAKLSIFVTDSAIATAGLSQDMLTSRVQNTLSNAYVKEEEIAVDVVESAMADHYIEFGGDGRSSGKRNVKGVVIRL